MNKGTLVHLYECTFVQKILTGQRTRMSSINHQQKDAIRSEIWSAFRVREPIRGNDEVRITGVKKSSCPLHPNAFNHAKIVREVNSLSPVLHAWALYVYAEKEDWKHLSALAYHIWNVFDETKTQKKTFTEKAKKQLQAMVFLAIQHQKSNCLYLKGRYTAAEIIQLLGIRPDNWRKNYKGHWERMNSLISDIDEQMLETIYQKTEGASNVRFNC